MTHNKVSEPITLSLDLYLLYNTVYFPLTTVSYKRLLNLSLFTGLLTQYNPTRPTVPVRFEFSTILI